MNANYLRSLVTRSTRNTLRILKDLKALNELPPEEPDRNTISNIERATITASKIFILFATYRDIPRPISLRPMSTAKI